MRARLRASAAHPRHVLLGAFVAGLLLGPWTWAAPLALAGLCVLAAALMGRGVTSRLSGVVDRHLDRDEALEEAVARRERWRRAVLVAGVGVALLAGAGVAVARLRVLDRTALGPWIGHAAEVRAFVVEAPRARSFGRQAAIVSIRSGPGRGEKVLVVATRLPSVVGTEIRARGGFAVLPEYESAARRRGAHALLRGDSVVPTGARRGGIAGALDGVRDRSDRALSAGLPPPLGALARGMVLGEDAALPADVSDDFKAAGLTHLVAASGANVALLAALVLALCALADVPLTGRLVLAGVAIAAYVPLAGGGPSILRAGVMGIAAIVATLASTAPSRWYALLLAAAVTLAANPRAAQDPGWQLSFAAVVSLLVLAPRLRARLSRRLPGWLADASAVTLAATIGTAPLIALHFGRVSPISVPANLLAAPAVAPVMWLGAVAAVAGQASPALAAPFTGLAAWPLAFLVWLGHASARAGVALAAAAALVVPGAGIAATPHGLVVSALDIGQGDATLIQDGPSAILVDTGPPGAPIVAELRNAGVRRLDVLVVTHAQADHEGGAAAVLGEVPVGLVLDGRDGNPSPDGDRFAAVAAARHVRLVAPDAGEELRAGPIALDLLSPHAEDRALHAGQDPNQRAIVAEVRDGGFTMLLTADAESDVLAGLPLEPVDVLKVSHHGSDDPGLPGLLARLRPQAALIEVGRHNTYGHPAPSTLAALGAAGVPEVARTDEDGTVRLRVQGGRLTVERHA